MKFKKTKIATVIAALSFLPLGSNSVKAEVIDIEQITGQEIVLTEDSSLLQSDLPTIAEGSTFSIKGKHTFTIGPSDTWTMVNTYADGTLNVEGSLTLMASTETPVTGGGIHTNPGSVIDIGENLTITGGFQLNANAIQLVGVRSDTTDKHSTLNVGNTLLVHDATFAGSGPYVIQLQNSDVNAKQIKLENINRTSTGKGPFYLLGLMGNSSNVQAETLDIVNVESDTGFRAIELDLPWSNLNVGTITVDNLTAKKGSYLNYSAAISSSGTVTADNIKLSNLTATSENLFAIRTIGKLDKDTDQLYLSNLIAGAITINNVTSLGNHVAGLYATDSNLNIQSIFIDGATAKQEAAGIVLSNLSEDSTIGKVTIKNVKGERTAVGLQADNVILSKGVEISGITALDDSQAALFATPVEQNETGIIIRSQDGVTNAIEGNLVTEYKPENQTAGKITAGFNGEDSHLTGATDTQQHGTIDLTFKNKAKWTVTENSHLTSLDMQSGVLAVDINLKDGVDEGTTQVDVQGEAKGSFDVALNITGEAAQDFTKSEDWILKQESGVLTVDKVTYQNGGVLAYDVKFFEDGAGADAEGTSSSTGNKGQWHVVLGQTNPDNPDGPDNPPVTPEVHQVLALGASVHQGLGMLSETEDLRMRMGEVKHGVNDGLWARTYARQDTAHGSYGRGFKQDIYGIHIGADRLISVDDKSSWLVGGAFHYGRSDMEGVADANGGGSDVDQYTFKAYATYLQDSGSFADIVVHVGYYDTELVGRANNGYEQFDAKYNNWGYGLSAELGHRFTFGQTEKSWFIEPTAQLTWFHADGQDFRTSTGLDVSQENADFITARLGTLIGKTFAYGPSSNPMSKYVSIGLKGGMLYQFDGTQSIKVNGTDGGTVRSEAMDLQGVRGYYGITADWVVDNSWRFYGQVSREQGSGYTKEFDVSLGVRYKF